MLWILSNAVKLDVPLGSDAHSLENLVFYFEEVAELFVRAGYSHVKVILDGKWQCRELAALHSS